MTATTEPVSIPKPAAPPGLKPGPDWHRLSSGFALPPRARGLPRPTRSLCPECQRAVPGQLFAEDGKVWMGKTCPEHGDVKEIVFSNVELYLKLENWTFEEGEGIANPAVPDAVSCPDDCGVCQMHTSHTGLANVDLTNRCDMTCPVCFANANQAGYIYEPPLDQIRQMLQQLRDMRPVAARVVQFSGGEPTIYPWFVEAVAAAKEVGFSHVQVATNGKTFANVPGLAERAKAAGLHTLYLQFDGVSDDVYRRTRGEAVWEMKQRAVQRVREAGLKIVLVPTICRGVNDHQVGDILRYAIENIDVISGISYQPVAFTGRIAQKKREAMRYTLADLAMDIGEQTGFTTLDDWYPTPCTTPVSRLVSALRGEKTTHLTCHPHCSVGTYLFVGQNGKATPITQFIDVEKMLTEFNNLAKKTERARIKTFSKIAAFNSAHKYFRAERAPVGLSFRRFLQTLEGFFDKERGRGEGDGTYTFKTLMVAGMHFQDSYNYEIDRVQRCVIHYSAPDGKVYPFCAYNSGPTFREKIEHDYRIEIEDYRAQHGDVVGIPKRRVSRSDGGRGQDDGHGNGNGNGNGHGRPDEVFPVISDSAPAASSARREHPAALPRIEGTTGDDDLPAGGSSSCGGGCGG